MTIKNEYEIKKDKIVEYIILTCLYQENNGNGLGVFDDFPPEIDGKGNFGEKNYIPFEWNQIIASFPKSEFNEIDIHDCSQALMKLEQAGYIEPKEFKTMIHPDGALTSYGIYEITSDGIIEWKIRQLEALYGQPLKGSWDKIIEDAKQEIRELESGKRKNTRATHNISQKII